MQVILPAHMSASFFGTVRVLLHNIFAATLIRGTISRLSTKSGGLDYNHASAPHKPFSPVQSCVTCQKTAEGKIPSPVISVHVQAHSVKDGPFICHLTSLTPPTHLERQAHTSEKPQIPVMNL